MDQVRRAALAWALALVCALVAAVFPRTRAAATDELETRTFSTYDVNADGSVRVVVAAQVTNRDPSTQRRSSGQVFFYSVTAFAVHDAAVGLTARSGGIPLMTEPLVEARDSGDPFRLVAVRFDRNLYYNESLEITLEYSLSAVRAAQLLVNRQYAFVPAIGQGTRSLVRITAPTDRRVTIGSSNCARTADAPVTYACGASTAEADYRSGGRCAFTTGAPRWDCAFTGRDFVIIPFEVAAADLTVASRGSRVPLAAGAVEVTVQHFTGDEAWAARVDDLIRRGLPILEQANGYPYPGPPSIEVVESGYRDTHGYEGLASSQGRIRLTPVVDDQTVLHEVAHLWSGVFASRWLAEGMADYTANVAIRQLGLKPDAAKTPLPTAPRLEEWGPLRSQIAVSRAERDLEEAGYARSLRFVELLAERAGTAAIGAANATLAREKLRGTARTYLDLLEEITGTTFAPLFAEWALTIADVQQLPARQVARANTTRLRERAARAGLTVPHDLERALRAWEFGRAEELAAAASAALDTHQRTEEQARATGYELGGRFAAAFAGSAEEAAEVARGEAAALDAVHEATERVSENRSLIMRLGLLGSDLSAQADAARRDLARGDFESAGLRASAIEHRVDGAARNGAIRIALVTGAFLLLTACVLLRGRSRAHPRHRAVDPR